MVSPAGHILVCESDGAVAASYSAALKKERNKWDVVTNGKDAQAIRVVIILANAFASFLWRV